MSLLLACNCALEPRALAKGRQLEKAREVVTSAASVSAVFAPARLPAHGQKPERDSDVRLRTENRRAVLSRPEVTARPAPYAAAQKAEVSFLRSLKAGDVVEGQVVATKGYGVLVNIGRITHTRVLLHVSQVSRFRFDQDLGTIFSPGNRLKGMVISKDQGNINISTSVLERQAGDMLRCPASVYANAEAQAAFLRSHLSGNVDPWTELSGTGSNRLDALLDEIRRLEALKPGDVVLGKVTGVVPYGAFLKIGRFSRKQALLHVSQISRAIITDIHGVLRKDDFIKAMVLQHDKKTGRIQLTTRFLEENAGDMLCRPHQVFRYADKEAARFGKHCMDIWSHHWQQKLTTKQQEGRRGNLSDVSGSRSFLSI
ncbi:hypothetical protein WJX73_002240 [Symbiochloris irregularis]|uniref:S1 motif domain-containing protein n=1 Tax=Symbiochloris irregularis TaxID=706552 RepID=A0AAW1PNU2_9CHLO